MAIHPLAAVEPIPIEGLAAAQHEAVAQINALEELAYAAEDGPSDIRWEQAKWVADALADGLSTRKLAALWMNPETGKPYSYKHAQYVARTHTLFGNLGSHKRPRFNTAYHSDEVR